MPAVATIASPVNLSRLALALGTPRRRRQMRVLLHIAVIAAGLVALKAFVIDPITGHFTGSFEDFSAYIGAARSMASGGSPYAQFTSTTVVMSGFTYPPFAAFLLSPLAVFGDRVAMSLWLCLDLACTIAATVILARSVLPKGWPRVELGLLAALTFAPATYNYWHGQINPVIMLLLVFAYWAYSRDRDLVCGVCIGFAAGIKLAPIVLVLLLLRRHWWRGAAAALLTGAATGVIGLMALGVGPTKTFLTVVFPTLNRGTGWIYNQSLTGVVSRLGYHSVLLVNPPVLAITAGGLAAGLAVLLVAVWVVRPGPRSVAERRAEFGLGVTAMLLAGALAWFPHFTYLLIPLFAVAGLVLSRGWRNERGLVAAAIATVVVFAVVAPVAIARFDINSAPLVGHGAFWWVLLQLYSLPGLTAAWLLVALALSLRRSESRSVRPEVIDALAPAVRQPLAAM
jgi:alpha-1,2-mannosyltransferase